MTWLDDGYRCGERNHWFCLDCFLREKHSCGKGNGISMMANEPIFLTGEEVSLLQAAVDGIVAGGIRIQDTEHQIPANGDGPAVVFAEETISPGASGAFLSPSETSTDS